MFLLGFVCGAAAAAWFILHDKGEMFVHLGEQMRQVARRYREWDDSRHI
jgi:hypothetical protein